MPIKDRSFLLPIYIIFLSKEAAKVLGPADLMIQSTTLKSHPLLHNKGTHGVTIVSRAPRGVQVLNDIFQILGHALQLGINVLCQLVSAAQE